MSSTQQLNNYIQRHPDFWEFENEAKEVARLKELCREDLELQSILKDQSEGVLADC